MQEMCIYLALQYCCIWVAVCSRFVHRSSWLCLLQPLTEVTEAANCLADLVDSTGPDAMQTDTDTLPEGVRAVVDTWLKRSHEPTPGPIGSGK